MPGKGSKVRIRKKDTRKRDYTSPGKDVRAGYQRGSDKFKVPAFDMHLWKAPNSRK